MATSALNVLSGIAAAAAGLAGDKVSKDGSVPGLDLASIVPALLGSKSGGASGLAGTLASVAAKSGLLNASNLGKVAELAGSLFTTSSKKTATTKSSAGGIAGLAAAVIGNTGSGSSLGSIATMATKLAKTASTTKELTGMASELGKTLSSKFGLSFGGSGTAVKALDKVMDSSDTKTDLFKNILKGIIS
jgi:hypothetical protein